MKKLNKQYISPEFEILRIDLIEDVLKGSLESDNGYETGGDDWDDWGSRSYGMTDLGDDW